MVKTHFQLQWLVAQTAFELRNRLKNHVFVTEINSGGDVANAKYCLIFATLLKITLDWVYFVI